MEPYEARKLRATPETKSSGFSVKDLIGLSSDNESCSGDQQLNSSRTTTVRANDDDVITEHAESASALTEAGALPKVDEQKKQIYENWLKNEHLRMSGESFTVVFYLLQTWTAERLCVLP